MVLLQVRGGNSFSTATCVFLLLGTQGPSTPSAVASTQLPHLPETHWHSSWPLTQLLLARDPRGSPGLVHAPLQCPLFSLQ